MSLIAVVINECVGVRTEIERLHGPSSSEAKGAYTLVTWNDESNGNAVQFSDFGKQGCALNYTPLLTTVRKGR